MPSLPVPSQPLLADLRRDEGLRLAAYPDALSGGRPWTIGYGHAGPEVHEGLVWTKRQAESALVRDATHALQDILRLPPTPHLDQVRIDALANMCFNLGLSGIGYFGRMWAALRAAYGLRILDPATAQVKYAAAAREALNSMWAKQVGARADRIAHMLRAGERVS